MSDNTPRSDPLYIPLTDEERMVIRAELRAWKRETDSLVLANGKEGQKIFAKLHQEDRQAALANAADFQKIFVRFSFALNGSAIVAILAFIGSIGGKADAPRLFMFAQFTRKLLLGVEFFLAGLAAATISAGIALLAWQFSAGTYFHAGQTSNMVSGHSPFGGLDEGKENKDFDRNDKMAPISMYASGLMSCGSLVLFIVGALKAAKALAFYSLLR